MNARIRATHVHALILAGAATACAAPVPDSEIVLTADLSAPSHAIGRLIGWNIGSSSRYAPSDDPRHPEWRTDAMVEAIARLRSVRAANGDRPLVRFSGLQIDGALGNDGYHFADYTAPNAPIASDDNLSPLEYMAIVDEIDADPMVTLNFGSGSAAEAADYVRYLVSTDTTDPQVRDRMSGGRARPWQADEYEVGNEVYSATNTGFRATATYSFANAANPNGGDSAWYGRPSASVEDFAARARAYVDAVHAANPAARLFIPLTQSSWDAWGGPTTALPAMSSLLQHEAVVGVVVHQYTYEDGIIGYGIHPNHDGWLLASADLYLEKYLGLRQALDAIPRAQPLELAITEYHSVANALDFSESYGPTPAAALGLADELMLFAEVGVDRALQHVSLALGLDADVFSKSWHVPFALQGDELIDRPSYTVTKLVADYLLDEFVPLNVERMPTRAYPTSSPTFTYDIVHAAAFVADTHNTASILLLNRDLDAPHELSVGLARGWHVERAEQVAPDDAWANLDQANVTREPIDVQVDHRILTITLPAHSLAAIRLTR